jgi:tRNA A37 N6-isopentenylltransferase MiaA
MSSISSTKSEQAFREIYARDHVPIVVGGTGFYIHALIYGPPKGPASVPDVRKKLEDEMTEKGSLVLYERLKGLDPEYASTITFRDRHKIIRALEIMTLTNQKVSFFEKGNVPSQEFDFRCWFLYMPKEILYPMLDQRCEKMVCRRTPRRGQKARSRRDKAKYLGFPGHRIPAMPRISQNGPVSGRLETISWKPLNRPPAGMPKGR